MGTLDGRVAVVTGAGMGIGRGIAGALARETGLVVYDGLAVALYAALVAAWAVAATQTARGLVSGALLAGPRPAPAGRAASRR